MNAAAKAQDTKTQQRLRDNMRLAEQLGARIVTVYGEDIPQQMAEYAKVSGVTKIVVGRTNARTSLLRGRRSFVDRLNDLTPDIDVYIIPDAKARPGYRPPRRSAALEEERLSLRSAVLALVILVISTALSVLSMRLGFHEVFVVILYVFGILLTAVTTGNQLLGLAMTVISVLAYNYFFTEPYYTLMVNDPGYIMAFLLMIAISLLTGNMARRVRRQARQEAQKAHRTDVLLQASQKFQRITDEEALLTQAAGELVALLGRSVIIYPARDTLGKPVFVPSKDDAHGVDFYTTPDEYAVAAWALKNRKHAGATTGTLPGAKCLYLTARSQTQVQAVVGISMTDCGELEFFEKNLLLTLMDLVSLAVLPCPKTVMERPVPGSSLHRSGGGWMPSPARAFLLLAQHGAQARQVDLVRHGDDRVAQHELFPRRALHADRVHLRLSPEDVIKHVFKLRAEVIVGDSAVVGALLDGEHQPDILHRQHGLDHRDVDQVRDLLAAILLAHRAGKDALLHVVAHHGARQLPLPQRLKAVADIPGHLLQIQPHVRNIPVARQADDRKLRVHPLADCLIHAFPTFRHHYTGRSTKSQRAPRIGDAAGLPCAFLFIRLKSPGFHIYYDICHPFSSNDQSHRRRP